MRTRPRASLETHPRTNLDTHLMKKEGKCPHLVGDTQIKRWTRSIDSFHDEGLVTVGVVVGQDIANRFALFKNTGARFQKLVVVEILVPFEPNGAVCQKDLILVEEPPSMDVQVIHERPIFGMKILDDVMIPLANDTAMVPGNTRVR